MLTRATIFQALILIDTNLPVKSGHEILSEEKADSHISMIPVTILSSSGLIENRMRALKHHAKSYEKRPAEISYSWLV